MSLLLQYGRRHWPAFLVLGVLVWRTSRDEVRENIVLWICIGLSALGIVMNLVVIWMNGKMPVAITLEEIGEEDHPYYRPIDESTRLAALADWIPLGNLMVSPGDVLLSIAVGILVLRFFVGVLG